MEFTSSASDTFSEFLYKDTSDKNACKFIPRPLPLNLTGYAVTGSTTFIRCTLLSCLFTEILFSLRYSTISLQNFVVSNFVPIVVCTMDSLPELMSFCSCGTSAKSTLSVIFPSFEYLSDLVGSFLDFGIAPTLNLL